jgi:diguanylate cyclase (GGDEF)-like protein
MSATRAPEPPAAAEAARLAALEAYAILDSAPEQAFDDIVRLAVTLCAVPAATISLIDRDRVWFKAQIGIDQPQVPREQSLCNHAIDAPRRTLVISDLAIDPIPAAKRRRLHGQPPRFYAGVPLLSPEGHPLGTLSVADTVPRQLTDAQVEGLELLARQTQHLLELRRMMVEQGRLLSAREQAAQVAELARAEWQRRHDALRQSATRDPLTGLLNRSAMEEMLAEALKVAPDKRVPYALLLLDIDHFKQVNDRHGHLAGDNVLRAVAQAVLQTIRQGDVAVRFGGEEILVYLPGTTLAAAAEVAHRIRDAVANADLPLPVTVSVGVAAGDPMRDRPEGTFDRADQALYRAKQGGRDRVAVDDTPVNA